MKKIITIMVLGLMVATAAMADGPKYGFISRPASSYQSATYGSGSVRNRRTLISNKVSIDRSAAAGGGYSRSASSLGLSSSASAGTSYQAGSSSFGGGSSSSVVYGRTSSTYGSSTGLSSGSYTSGQSRIAALPSVGNNGETDGELTGIGGALIGGNTNSPNVIINNENGQTKDGPIGDAIIPMLLLISLITIYKWRKMH